MKYLFYPGCSLQRTSRPYLDSILAILPYLDLDLEEIEDWNCCGATEYISVHRTASQALVARNLALAEQQKDGGQTLVAACSACYLNLAKTEHQLRDDKALAASVNDALAAGGLHYDPGSLDVRHLLDVVCTDVGLETVRSLVSRPLNGLRIAPYYGCMLVRSDPFARFKNSEYPMRMDRLMRVLGAEVVDFPPKTHCCGGHMTQISPAVAYDLIRRLLHAADHYQADLMVTTCPMCQLNLDAYQDAANDFYGTDFHIPILYFTQMMGLAFGLDAETLGIGREFVPARPALSKIGVEVPEAESAPAEPRKPRRKDEGLPMPVMPGRNGES